MLNKFPICEHMLKIKLILLLNLFLVPLWHDELMTSPISKVLSFVFALSRDHKILEGNSGI